MTKKMETALIKEEFSMDEKIEKSQKRRERKTYVISSAQAIQSEENRKIMGADSSRGAPHKTFIEGLEYYCKRNNAELLILTMNGMNVKDKNMHSFFDGLEARVLLPEERNLRLNKNCLLSDDVVPPQNMDPATSRDRLVQTDQTRVYAHSKQRLKTVASGNRLLPKLLATTGACTHPNYDIRNHKGDMASKEHTYGAIVVEIVDEVCFNIRHIQALKTSGKFIDMARAYDGNKLEKKKVGVEALVLGDIHWGDHDSLTMHANYEMIHYFKPKRLFLHDFLNGHSVNPHERDNLLGRTKAFEAGRLSIEEELKEAYSELVRIAKRMKGGEVNVVFSNHPFFIERYLESGRYVHEPWNAKMAIKLADAMLRGEDPVEAGIKMMGPVPSNVNFLGLADDYKVRGWQLASHGHKGISGARGSIKSRELGYGKSITGHTHAPEILRNTYIVGTSTRLDLPYTEGSMSKWMAANAVLYESGQVQMLPIINGKWKMKRK